MPRIAMLEPTYQLPHHRMYIGPMSKIGKVALECSEEALCHPVTLRTAHPSRYRLQPQPLSKETRLRRRVAGVIVGRPFHMPDRLAVGTLSTASARFRASMIWLPVIWISLFRTPPIEKILLQTSANLREEYCLFRGGKNSAGNFLKLTIANYFLMTR